MEKISKHGVCAKNTKNRKKKSDLGAEIVAIEKHINNREHQL